MFPFRRACCRIDRDGLAEAFFRRKLRQPLVAIDANDKAVVVTATDPSTNGPAPGNPAPGSIVARNGNVAIRTTSIPGLLLANDIHGLPFSNASGMLLGARRDVHLDGGTRLVLAVAMAPQSGGSGMSR